MLFIQVFPLILVADKLKAMLVASMTTEIERLNKKRKDVRTINIISNLSCRHVVLFLRYVCFHSVDPPLNTSCKQSG